MSYKYYVNKRNPVASFILDDTPPFFDNSGWGSSGVIKSGSSAPDHATALVSGATRSSVFNSSSVAEFEFSLFKRSMERRAFVLEAWVLPIPGTTTGPQQILSHDGQFDGISIDGKVITFSIEYETADPAVIDYDLQTYQAAHVVAVHNAEQNQLWVNNRLVAAVDLTEEQKADSYPSWADEFLYCGDTASTQSVAVNGVAFYSILPAEQINQNYLAGIDTILQSRVPSQFDGVAFALNSAIGTKYIDRSWTSRGDFNQGLKDNVEYATDQIEPAYENDVSVSGTWTASVPLDTLGYTDIYGVMVDWSGKDVSVDVSIDGSSWTAATSGELISIISNHFNPTDIDLQIRVSFAGGLAEDPAYLESLNVIAYKDNIIANTTTRDVTASHPAVLRGDYEPVLYRDDNGISLYGGTLTIGVDASPDPDPVYTIELWIKPMSGTPTISVTGTQYRNGYADSTIPVGEWQLIHIVSATDVTSEITVSGNCIVGQAVLYPTQLTADQIEHVYKSYTGRPVVSFVDEFSPILVEEDTTPLSIYAHDWSITAAG